MRERQRRAAAWLAEWSRFTGYPYRLFDGALGTIGLSFFWYIKTVPAQSTDTVLSGLGLALFGAHTWGWLLFITGWVALVASMFGHESRRVGYSFLLGLTAAWSVWLVAGAVIVRLATDGDPEMMWKAVGSGWAWGIIASHLLYQVLRQREDAARADLL